MNSIGSSTCVLMISLMILCSPAMARQASPDNALSPGAAEVAGLIGISPLIERLERMPDSERRGADGTISVPALMLKEQVTEAVLAESLEVDGVFAEIDDEVSISREVQAYLESKRDRTIGINTVANILTGGGVGVVGQLLQLKYNTAGNLVGAAAGGVSTLISIVGMRQQQGDQASLGAAPNMLAKFFDRNPEFHSDYPDVAWAYLNAQPPTESGTGTRKEQLIREWVRLGRVDPIGSAKAQAKIDLLTSSVSLQRSLSIDLLSDREIMLSDVRARLSLMKRDLSKLMAFVRTL